MDFPLSSRLPHASRLILGCMGLGGNWDHQPLSAENITQAQAAVEAALEIGITVFDHANIYTLGKAEQCFGALFRQQPDLREKMILQSKCGIRFADNTGPKRYDLSAEHILSSVDESLRRLNTDYLDILMLHRPDPLAHPNEIAEAWAQLKTAGKVRHLGASNMSATQMSWLSSALDEPFINNQLEMSLLKLDWLNNGTCFNDTQGHNSLAWAGTLEYCQQQKIQIQAWGSLGKGWFSGSSPYDAPSSVQQTAQLAQELAHQYQTSRESIVLAWLMLHPAAIQPVIGTTNPERIRACADAVRIELSREDWYRLYVCSRVQELP